MDTRYGINDNTRPWLLDVQPDFRRYVKTATEKELKIQLLEHGTIQLVAAQPVGSPAAGEQIAVGATVYPGRPTYPLGCQEAFSNEYYRLYDALRLMTRDGLSIAAGRQACLYTLSYRTWGLPEYLRDNAAAIQNLSNEMAAIAATYQIVPAPTKIFYARATYLDDKATWQPCLFRCNADWLRRWWRRSPELRAHDSGRAIANYRAPVGFVRVHGGYSPEPSLENNSSNRIKYQLDSHPVPAFEECLVVPDDAKAAMSQFLPKELVAWWQKVSDNHW